MKHYKGTHDIAFYVFTDTDPRPYAPNLTNIHYFHTIHIHWQDGTNSKFKNMLELADEPCDYLYYFDADTNVTKDFTEAWFLGDLVGGEHYNNCYKQKDGTPEEKPYDRNPSSKAYVPRNTQLPQMYYYGAFFGGKKEQILQFCQTSYNNQLADKAIRYEPVWNDESYINCYFHFTPPSFVVPAKKFEFGVSDKGGIGETRKTSLDIMTLKQQVLEHPTSIFDIRNGKLVLEREKVVQIKGDYLSLDLTALQVYVLGGDSKRIQTVLSTFSKPHMFVNKASLIDRLEQFSEQPDTFAPFVIVQDCVAIQPNVSTTLSYPTNSDCVYIGISRFSATHDYTNYQEGVEFQTLENQPSLVKLRNMLSSHAYVVLSLKWLKIVLDCYKQSDVLHLSVDLLLAKQMTSHHIYAMRTPLFYQDGNAGGQEEPTNVSFDAIVRLV